MDTNIYFIVNSVALGVASVAAIAILGGVLRWYDKTTGGRMIVLTTSSITGWIVLSFLELFIASKTLSFSITVFGTAMVVGLLLVAMSVPNKPFTWLHWLILGFGVPFSLVTAIPGIVYNDLVRTADGYSELIPGAYFNLHQGIVVPAFLLIAVVVYVSRFYHEQSHDLRVLLRLLGIGHTLFILVGMSTIIVLPAFGYSQFSNIGTAFILVFLMGTMTYAFIAYGRKFTNEKLPTNIR